MDKIQIDVLKLKCFQLSSECSLDVFLVSVMPEFGDDEQIFTLNTFSEAFLECFTYLGFIFIDLSGVDVSVSMLKDRSF